MMKRRRLPDAAGAEARGGAFFAFAGETFLGGFAADGEGVESLVLTDFFSRAGGRGAAASDGEGFRDGIFAFSGAFTPVADEGFSFKGVEAAGETSTGVFLRVGLLAIP